MAFHMSPEFLSPILRHLREKVVALADFLGQHTVAERAAGVGLRRALIFANQVCTITQLNDFVV